MGVVLVVARAWLHPLAAEWGGARAPETALVRSMVRQLCAVPLALDHPKEDEFLFRSLRERTTSLRVELDELECQHDRDHRLVGDHAARVDVLESGADDTAPAAAPKAPEDAVGRYASFLCEHMGREDV